MLKEFNDPSIDYSLEFYTHILNEGIPGSIKDLEHLGLPENFLEIALAFCYLLRKKNPPEEVKRIYNVMKVIRERSSIGKKELKDIAEEYSLTEEELKALEKYVLLKNGEDYIWMPEKTFEIIIRKII